MTVVGVKVAVKLGMLRGHNTLFLIGGINNALQGRRRWRSTQSLITFISSSITTGTWILSPASHDKQGACVARVRMTSIFHHQLENYLGKEGGHSYLGPYNNEGSSQQLSLIFVINILLNKLISTI